MIGLAERLLDAKVLLDAWYVGVKSDQDSELGLRRLLAPEIESHFTCAPGCAPHTMTDISDCNRMSVTVAQQAREFLSTQIRPNNAREAHHQACYWLDRLRSGSRRQSYPELRAELRAYRELCVQKSLKWGLPWVGG